MTKTTRFGMRGLRGAVAAAVVLGLAHPALAWDQPQWVRQLGKTGTANGVATDIDGNVYIAGWFDGSLLAKYSAAGALRWTRQLGTCCYDIAGVATDGDGNVYIAGWTGLGALVAKYSAAGVLRWKRQLGTSEWDTAYGVATDGDGNVYIAGYTEGSLGAAQRGNGDAWVAKYSAAGVLRWKRQLGTSEWDTAYGVATAGDGTVYIAGVTMGSLGGPNPDMDMDAWVAKYSAAGALRWTRQGPEPPGGSQDGAYGVATDGDGTVYIAGSDGTDGYLAKYSAAGTLRWTRRVFLYAGMFYRHGVATDGDGNVYIAGSTDTFTPPDHGFDAYVAKYSAAGELRWARQLGTSSVERANGVATDGDGNVYIAGETNFTSNPAWVAKYSTRP